jgi:hypothetical protein
MQRERVKPSAIIARRRLAGGARDARIPACVFCLTIFFNDSIQLTNCDEMHVAMFHDKWKGRIETMATKKAAKKAKKAAKKSKKH